MKAAKPQASPAAAAPATTSDVTGKLVADVVRDFRFDASTDTGERHARPSRG